nr:PREDICTED: PRKC apoptosis WT1 regulator protein [Apteryx mantelli mantelli]
MTFVQKTKIPFFVKDIPTISQMALDGPTRSDTQLDLPFTSKQELVGDMIINGSLGCSDHEIMESKVLSTPNAPEEDVANRYSRTDRTTYSRYSRDANSSGNSVPSNALEKRIEELERELAKERQENVRLMKITQDKEELIVKLKEEIDLLNRDLDDIEDENEQLKQENKTLLKVVGQLTRNQTFIH